MPSAYAGDFAVRSRSRSRPSEHRVLVSAALVFSFPFFPSPHGLAKLNTSDVADTDRLLHPCLNYRHALSLFRIGFGEIAFFAHHRHRHVPVGTRGASMDGSDSLSSRRAHIVGLFP